MDHPDFRGTSGRRTAAAAAVLALAVGLVGCRQGGSSGTSPEKRFHLQKVSIDAQGSADPELVKVKKKVEIVVWEAPAGTKLQIAFAENPFPQPVICPGDNFCASLVPPQGEEKIYPYTVTVTAEGGGSMKMDPRLEVVP